MSSTDNSNDCLSSLLLRARRGDARAFAELYRQLAPVVRAFAASLDGELSPHDHDDLAQEVFTRTWQSRANYRGEASAKTFVLAITRNVVLKRLERAKRNRPLSPVDLEFPCEGDATVRRLELQESVEAVHRALSKLTAAQRQAVDLALIRELPRAEAVKLAKCSHRQFAKRLERGVRSLGQLLRQPPRHPTP